MRDRVRRLLTVPTHLASMLGYFWSSEVNTAAVALLDPKPGEQVLDIGAGLGPATVEAAKRVGPSGRVIAVEPSRSMRTVLRARRLVQPTRRVIDILAAGAEHIPLARRSVQAALGLNVMHHLSDPEMATTELARVLEPGGRLLLVDEDFDHPDHRFHHHGQHPDHGGEDHEGHGIEFVDLERMRSLLADRGFVDLETAHRTIAGQPAYVVSARRPG